MGLVETVETLGVPEKHEEQERFRIETKDQAAWALRKLSKLQAEQEENRQVAQIEIERISSWLEEENETIKNQANFFEYLLEEYFLKLRQDDPKRKTVKLPHGALKMRKQQPRYLYDEEQLLPWAKENLPDAVQVKETVAKNLLKKYIKETGEVVPGVEIEERPEKFSVEVL